MPTLREAGAFCTALALCFEMRAGGASKWQPYLSSLPACVAFPPLTWTEEDVASAAGTPLPAEWRRRRELLDRIFREVVHPVMRRHAEALGMDVKDREGLEALWRKALAVVKTRAFATRPEALLPIADLATRGVTG
jgi:hypothetical protein